MSDDRQKIIAHTIRSLITAISDPVLICARDGTVSAANAVMRSFLVEKLDAPDRSIEDLNIFALFPDGEEQLEKIFSLCLSQSGIFPCTLRMPHFQNEEQDRIPLQASMLQLDGVKPSHILFRFLSSNSVSKQRFESLNATLRNKNKQLLIQRELARNDAHTGVWQRATLFEELPHYLGAVKNKGVTTSFVVIDLDNFKEINDRYGHPCGDLVLASVGKLLLQACRSKDRVARIGGEEFAMILPETNVEEAKRACQRMRRAIMETQIPYEDQNILVTASFGVTEAMATDDSEDVYKRADYALYSAKKAGRNTVISILAPPST